MRLRNIDPRFRPVYSVFVYAADDVHGVEHVDGLGAVGHGDGAKLKRAGLDYWHLLDITYYGSTAEFFEKNSGGKFFYFSTKARNIYSDVSYPDGAYLVFGKETAGLPEQLLYDNPGSCVRIPMINRKDARSLNLSNSVAVGVYEVLRQWGFPDLLTEGELTKFSWNGG